VRAAPAAAWVLLALAPAGCGTPPTRDEVLRLSAGGPEALELAYASDYLSFVGRDDRGPVAFAIDTNRGRDGESWQAEHFLVLYDGATCRREVPGGGAYPNPDRVLGAQAAAGVAARSSAKASAGRGRPNR